MFTKGGPTDEDAATALANGHPKSKRAPVQDRDPFPTGSPSSGSAPGANGPPTTGAPSMIYP